MQVSKRRSLAAALGAMSLTIAPVPVAAEPADNPVVTIEAVQGSIVRWSVPGTKRCGLGGRSWAALQETCYYPIDLAHKTGLVRVSRQGVGPARFANISVGASSYGTQDIELGDIPQANPSPADLRRNARDQALVEIPERWPLGERITVRRPSLERTACNPGIQQAIGQHARGGEDSILGMPRAFTAEAAPPPGMRCWIGFTRGLP